MKKRTNVDFSKHEHKVEIFKSDEWKEIRVDHFRKPDSWTYYIQFINTDRTLTITWDVWNWVFCRPFIPSPDWYVSDMYWCEKLRINSVQTAWEYDSETAQKEIQEIIDGLEDSWYEWDDLKEMKEWYESLLSYTENETEFLYHAHYEYGRPDNIDHEDIPNGKMWHCRLEVIFDAFDEICARLKNI